MNPIQALIDAAERKLDADDAWNLNICVETAREADDARLALRAAIPAARAEMEEGAPYALFGRLFVEEVGKRHEWWGDEWSEEIMPLAVKAGLAERVVYDPEIHGEGIEAEPGDEIWYWLPGPPKETP